MFSRTGKMMFLSKMSFSRPVRNQSIGVRYFTQPYNKTTDFLLLRFTNTQFNWTCLIRPLNQSGTFSLSWIVKKLSMSLSINQLGPISRLQEQIMCVWCLMCAQFTQSTNQVRLIDSIR